MTFTLLRPRDGFTIRDARGFHGGGGAPARSLPWPLPATVAGAVRAAVGHARGYVPTERSNQAESARWLGLLKEVALRGPLAVHAAPNADAPDWKPLWPAPLDALRVSAATPGGTLQRLSPAHDLHSGEGVRSLGRAEHAAMRSLWWPTLPDAGKPLSMPRWWTDADFLAWLRAQPVAQLTQVRGPETRVDVRVSINPDTGAARDGALFAHDTRELVSRDKNHRFDEIAIAVDVAGAALPPNAAVRFGSVGRVGRFEAAAPTLFRDPQIFTRPVKRLRLVLVTPGNFARGWLPDWFDAPGDAYVGTLPGTRVRATLRGACVDRAVPLSGWDLVARGPRPVRRLVGAGAVYFVELDRAIGEAEANGLWLRSMQHDQSQEARDGYGLMVAGEWPAENE